MAYIRSAFAILAEAAKQFRLNYCPAHPPELIITPHHGSSRTLEIAKSHSSKLREVFGRSGLSNCRTSTISRLPNAGSYAVILFGKGVCLPDDHRRDKAPASLG